MRRFIRTNFWMAPILAAIAASYLGAFLLRFDFWIPESQAHLFRIGLVIFLAVKAAMFLGFRLHSYRWRFTGLFDLYRILMANVAASVAAFMATRMAVGEEFPRSVYVLDGVLCFLAVAGLQLSVRYYWEIMRPHISHPHASKTVLIYGAGVAGATLAKEVRCSSRLDWSVAGFLDDDPSKLGMTLSGFQVIGNGRDAARLAARFEHHGHPLSEILIAMPSATGRQMREAISNCRAAHVPFKTLPGLSELLSGKISRQIREVSPNDLLGRDPVQIDQSRIGQALTGKSVMVTGGCGSIGSELCRQVARFSPSKLVIFDQAESEMFMLAMELRSRNPGLNLVTEIGDIVCADRISQTMARHGTQVVFHAAAYKHVPLMEENVWEAARNNVIGTYNVAQSACRQGVESFVLISTDKAVNPTSIMGLTKRIAELIVSAMPLDGSQPKGPFVAVRFGNVLGSSGSVVPIFRRQIAAGGPITITHPEMRRFFMSISEAVQLVLQAGAMAEESEVFVLDMGEQVPIMDLARNMIRLVGLVPDQDIEIRVTGLRPGEKLFEELQFSGEDVLPTGHAKVKRLRSSGARVEHLDEWLDTLETLLRVHDSDGIRLHLASLVPEYRGALPVRRLPRSAPALQPALFVKTA